MSRQAGILCPISSLNGEFGIGQLGKPTYDFIEYLSSCGFSHWQILPTNPVGAGSSPYSSSSAFAGYFALIDPLNVVSLGLASSLDLPSIYHQQNKVDYPYVEKEMEKFLRKSFQDFFSKSKNELLTAYDFFVSENAYWLNNYALYAALKSNNNNKPWYEWPDEFKFFRRVEISADDRIRENIEYFKFVQFLFFKQWKELKYYAANKNIEIIGDMPIYVSYDSADVWSQIELFDLNEDLSLKSVAGVPPDFFAQDGQLWGFPIYNWQKHQETSFKWWQSRWSHLRNMFDFVRFDHFRAIEAYWSVPAYDSTARNGQWIKAPGRELLEALFTNNSKGMIAENLGDISSEVEELRKEFNIPGMKIFQFAFGGHILSEHLPHFAEQNDIYYSGTHDNNVLKGWLKEANFDQINHLMNYYGTSIETINSLWLVDRILSSGANLVIIPIQDFMNLDESSRTNIPGTVSADNWSWRFTQDQLLAINPKQIFDKLQFFGRNLSN